MSKIFLVINSIIVLTISRYFETSLKFTQFDKDKGWIYIDKMTFAPGTVKV